MQVISSASLIDRYMGDLPREGVRDRHGTYPFNVRVGIIKACPPRHERFDLIREMGCGFIDAIINHQPFRSRSTLTFVFPERHMSVHEQRYFMNRLRKHPQVAEIRLVEIITSSPIMISDFHGEQVRVISFEDDVMRWPA